MYLDDIDALPNFEQHLADLEEVLARLQSVGFSLKLRKCQFCHNKLIFLGYHVTPSGLHPDLYKVRAAIELKVPTSLKQV